MARGLSQINDEEDIYKVGTLCQAKVVFDKNNMFSPYAINLYCIEKAMI
jgi:hypothetical protein